MQGRHLDGDVGNSGRCGSEAAVERVEIGQSAGIKFGVDGGGEFSLAGTIMSERQQPDHGVARLLLAVTGQQRFESPSDLAVDNARLRRENERLRMERDILKKAALIFGAASR